MKEMDVTRIAPKDRHPLIFKAFDELATGDELILTNDHDPKPLYYVFLHEREGQFGWEYHEQGPTRWKVKISKK
jgi:regulator of cell morphogenesis and NO signaling